jgi:hypothetical protein
MAKTLLFTGTGTITPNAGVNTLSIIDPSIPQGIVVEGLLFGDVLKLVRQHYAENGWEDVTDGNRTVNFTRDNRKEALIIIPGIYGLSGNVGGTVTAYSVDAT